MSQKTELDELLKQEATLVDQLYAVRVTIRERQLDVAYKTFGLLPDKTVLSCRGKKYRFHSITRVWENSKPWVVGALLKKDNTRGSPTKHLYDNWEVVK